MLVQKKYILSIDHGTSGGKVAIISTHGDVMEWAFEEVPIHVFKGGGAEQDPQDWWNAIKTAAKKVIDTNCVPVDDIVGVCNTSQWSGTVALDKNGDHLMNSIIWMDTRGAKYMEKIHKSIFQVSGYSLRKMLAWIKRTGGGPSLSGKDPIAHILWLKHNEPDIYNKTYMFLEPQDYVNFKLTGKFAASYASIHMHWLTDIRDINNITYSNKLIKMLKLDKSKFPTDLRWSTQVLGSLKKEVADELGLNKETQVVMGAPDLYGATIGSGAVKDYEAHICIGTSDWLLCHVPFKKTDIFHNMASIPAAFPGKYMLVNEQEIAGGSLTFLRDNILYHKDELLMEEAVPDVYKIFDKIVENTPAGSNNLIFAPWLIGERSPVDDHSIRGGLFNLSLEMSRKHIIRAIFEGVAYNVNWLFIFVEKFIEKAVRKENPSLPKAAPIIPELSIIGGGARSDVWCQIFADVLNRKIKRVKDPIQANARGAAFMAAVGLGYIEWEHIGKHTKIDREFLPNPDNRALYNKLFSQYVNIYKSTQKICKVLND